MLSFYRSFVITGIALTAIAAIHSTSCLGQVINPQDEVKNSSQEVLNKYKDTNNPLLCYGIQKEDIDKIEDQCSICLQKFENGEKVVLGLKSNTGCHNIFHYDCINSWKNSRRGKDGKCPTCRNNSFTDEFLCSLVIGADSITINYELFLETCFPDNQHSREKILYILKTIAANLITIEGMKRIGSREYLLAQIAIYGIIKLNLDPLSPELADPINKMLNHLAMLDIQAILLFFIASLSDNNTTPYDLTKIQALFNTAGLMKESTKKALTLLLYYPEALKIITQNNIALKETHSNEKDLMEIETELNGHTCGFML